MPGVEFDPYALIFGKASVGYRKLNMIDANKPRFLRCGRCGQPVLRVPTDNACRLRGLPRRPGPPTIVAEPSTYNRLLPHGTQPIVTMGCPNPRRAVQIGLPTYERPEHHRTGPPRPLHHPGWRNRLSPQQRYAGWTQHRLPSPPVARLLARLQGAARRPRRHIRFLVPEHCCYCGFHRPETRPSRGVAGKQPSCHHVQEEIRQSGSWSCLSRC